MSALEPYRAGRDGPWGWAQAGHLLRRAGFCGSADEIRAALEAGLDATVERLLDERERSQRCLELEEAAAGLAASGSIEKLAAWWLLRMVHTSRPLRARMALLWHNHFATSNQKVNSPAMMLQQMQTLERHALGRFDELLLAVSRDPAMIVWLDGDSNRKGHPNENYARELFELFSLGPGHYSEQDIQQAARAFSGWHQKGGRFHFQPRLHDEGEKTVFGRTGSFDGGDIVRMAVDHPACAAFIGRKLLREFVCAEPGEPVVEALAAVIRAEQFDLAAVMRRLLLSRAMFDEGNYRARIKSPVEFCVGLARSFEMRVPGPALHQAASQMGQRLLEPPSVKGWEGHRRWINSATMLVRMNAATVAASGDEGRGLDAGEWVRRMEIADAGAAVRFACEVMLDGRVPAELRSELERVCVGGAEAALRTAVAAIGSSPLYQLA